MNTHKLTIKSKCPHGGDDLYEATFETKRVILTEMITTAVQCATKSPVYQESMTKTLAHWLACRVTTVGMHGEVRTESVYGEP